MALVFKKGDSVRQVVPVITGTVKDMTIIDGEVMYLVEYADAEGQVASRYFKEDEIAALT